jgi:transcriptional regulator with XRE-family HTH domain
MTVSAMRALMASSAALIDRGRYMTSLKQWRKARKLTQEQAAQALGISYRHFQKLEAGHCPLTDRTVLLMQLL